MASERIRVLPLALAALLAGCAQRVIPPPRPQPAPPATPQPQPTPPQPVAPPPEPGWVGADLTPGDWSLEEAPPRAVFGFAGRQLLVISCAPGRSILLTRVALGAPALIVRTTYGERRLPAVIDDDLTARLSADDPLLDDIVFSRGRFAVEVEGTERLVLPSWPEPARVIEDCREQ